MELEARAIICSKNGQELMTNHCGVGCEREGAEMSEYPCVGIRKTTILLEMGWEQQFIPVGMSSRYLN